MNTLDFTGVFKGTDGKDTDEKLSKSLANFLATETKGNALKLLGWVEILSKEGVLEIDDSDKRLLEQTIESTDRMTVLLKGQLLRVLIQK